MDNRNTIYPYISCCLKICMVVLTIEDRECTDIDPARTDKVKYKDI